MIAWSIHKHFVHPPAKEPVLLGYGRLLGGEPLFLPAEDAADWGRDDAWMDLDAWRRWLGGTLTDHVTKLLTEAELRDRSSSVARTVGAATSRPTAGSRKSAQADKVQEPSGHYGTGGNEHG
ncbi:MAG TPA: hypothetical protein PLF11_07460 [Bacillota bacterium]|mgnify:CR=1 FL=1|nr:hypothetical protein [Bacillota bacterium]